MFVRLGFGFAGFRLALCILLGLVLLVRCL